MGEEYRRDELILGIDTDTVLEVGISGLNYRVGELVAVLFKCNSEGGANTPSLVDRILICIEYGSKSLT